MLYQNSLHVVPKQNWAIVYCLIVIYRCTHAQSKPRARRAHNIGVVNDISRHVEAWMMSERSSQTLSRCCSLHLGPKWHGVVTSLSLSFRFILLASYLHSLSAARRWLRPAGQVELHFLELPFSHSTLFSCLPSSCCRCHAVAALGYKPQYKKLKPLTALQP